MIEDLGEKLMLARRNADMSQEELAGISNVSHSMIASIELGRRIPSVETLNRIALAMGCSLEISFKPRCIEIKDLGDIFK